MAKKRKAKRKSSPKSRRSLPYKTVKVYRNAKTGKLVGKNFRGRRKVSLGYISKLTGKRISKATKSKNPKVQGFREAFPRRSEKTRRKIRATINEYRKLGFNPMEESPGLKRYFGWLRKNKPALYNPVLKAIGQNMQRGRGVNVVEIESEVEETYADISEASKFRRPRKGTTKLDRRRKAKG